MRSMLGVVPLIAFCLMVQAPLPSQEVSRVASERPTNETLGLARSLPIGVATYELPTGGVVALLDMGVQLEMFPHSVRAPGYQLLVQQEDGTLVPHEPGPVRTLRGRVVGLPGSVVAGSLLDDGLHARISVQGEDFWLQPIGGPRREGPQRHVLYRDEDVLPHSAVCADEHLQPRGPVPVPRVDTEPVSDEGRVMAESNHLTTAMLGCDADYEFFLDYGSDATAVANRISWVINTMNVQYERDVGIEHAISTIVVRTTSGAPYTSMSAGGLLDQFIAEWKNNQGGIVRDLAQLFTGKELNGNVIGVAATLGGVCDPNLQYSLVQSDFANNDACATDLSAHENGHVWNADHCGCRNFTMNRFITCANRFHSRQTIPEIQAYAASLACFGGGPGPDPDPGGDPTSVQVSVTASTQGIGGGQKKGKAVVVVTDDLGAPVAGATVTGYFSEPSEEPPVMDVTDANGSVTFLSNATGRGRVPVMFCVTALSNPAMLPWSQASPVCDTK